MKQKTNNDMEIVRPGYVMIMDRVRTEEQEKALFDLLNSMPEVHITKEEIDNLKIQ